jgi:hypothetical protein
MKIATPGSIYTYSNNNDQQTNSSHSYTSASWCTIPTLSSSTLGFIMIFLVGLIIANLIDLDDFQWEGKEEQKMEDMVFMEFMEEREKMEKLRKRREELVEIKKRQGKKEILEKMEEWNERVLINERWFVILTERQVYLTAKYAELQRIEKNFEQTQKAIEAVLQEMEKESEDTVTQKAFGEAWKVLKKAEKKAKEAKVEITNDKIEFKEQRHEIVLEIQENVEERLRLQQSC